MKIAILLLAVFAVSTPIKRDPENNPRLSSRASGWTHRGCVQDGGNGRLLSKKVYSGNLNTPDYCVNLCAGQKFKYAGVQCESGSGGLTSDGNECWCGNSLDNGMGKVLDAGKCSSPCPGDKGQKCGGTYISNLYENPGGSPGSLGCYVDNGKRVLPSKVNVQPLTRGGCVAACAAGNYKFAGVENGIECWCGNDMPGVKTDGCNVKCQGNGGELCGGSWKIEVLATGKGGSVPDLGGNGNGNNLKPVSSNAATVAFKVDTNAPQSAGTKLIWAHHMVGNTFSYNQANWASDIAQAKAAGIDGFALNMGRDPWQPQSVAWAYAAAQASGFKVFFSFDMTSFTCNSDGDANTIANLIKKYANHPAQAKYRNKVLVTTFAGDACTFGAGNVQNGWANVKKKSGVDYIFMPSTFMTPASIKSATWFDGQMNWDAAWPNSNQAPNTNRDTEWMSALGSKAYMAPISPIFFTYYGANSWNKNWIYRSDDWLLATRFEQLISLRPRLDMIQILSWNDYGESHYIGGIGKDQPNSQGWTTNMPHTSLQSLVKLYATAFKTGSYPAPQDHLWLWTRPHPRNAKPSSPSNPRPKNADWTYDNLYVVVSLASPAQVKIESGSNTATWNLEKGLSKLAIASGVGAIKATVVRGNTVVKKYDSSGKFAYSDKPRDYNFNTFCAEA